MKLKSANYPGLSLELSFSKTGCQPKRMGLVCPPMQIYRKTHIFHLYSCILFVFYKPILLPEISFIENVKCTRSSPTAMCNILIR